MGQTAARSSVWAHLSLRLWPFPPCAGPARDCSFVLSASSRVIGVASWKQQIANMGEMNRSCCTANYKALACNEDQVKFANAVQCVAWEGSFLQSRSNPRTVAAVVLPSGALLGSSISCRPSRVSRPCHRPHRSAGLLFQPCMLTSCCPSPAPCPINPPCSAGRDHNSAVRARAWLGAII